MFREALTEKMKLEIARIYHTIDTPVEAIATQLNVSASSVHRFKNYGYSTKDEPQDQPQSTYPEKEQDHKTRQRRCKRCGYTTDKKIKGACPGCGSGPFDSISVEIGSPEYERFIEENQKWRALEEQKTFIGRTENEEICDMTKDYWACQDCDYCSNTEFKICPECKSRDVVFAPDGIEPRDPSKYGDPGPQDNEEPEDENEKNAAMTGEEQQQELEYECPHCHKEFNGVLERCPHCGTLLEDSWECPKCHHRWYGSPDKCPKCGAELQA